MARLCVDLGRVNSKYDCVLGANLHPAVPVDRHVFAKRVRVWVNADGFISPLDSENLRRLRRRPAGRLAFRGQRRRRPHGGNRTDAPTCSTDENTTVLPLQPARPPSRAIGKQLPADADVRLTVRVDIEDRNFHCETQRNGGADHHFHSTHPPTRPKPTNRLRLHARAGPPAARLRRRGAYHPQPEWSENIPHPVEASARPGRPAATPTAPAGLNCRWPKARSVTLVADGGDPAPAAPEVPQLLRPAQTPTPSATARRLNADALRHAARPRRQAFVVRRGDGKTVIAGYPWFLDWGRDTLICARGLLAAGMVDEVQQILLDLRAASSRTAPCPTPSTATTPPTATPPTRRSGSAWCARNWPREPDRSRLLLDRRSTPTAARIARRAARASRTITSRGTPNGIRMDPDSGLIWSPSHFTWMDTNYPAGTPREGYPVEIQALWIRLLRQLEQHRREARRARTMARPGRPRRRLRSNSCSGSKTKAGSPTCCWPSPASPRRDATPDDALRSNCLFAVSLGLVDRRARPALRGGRAAAIWWCPARCAPWRRCR